jgi:signal transduction histidine kinase
MVVENQSAALLSSRVRLAALVESDGARILATYLRRLEERDSVLVRDSAAREQVIEQAGQILSDVAGSLRAGSVLVGERYRRLSHDIGETRAARGIHPHESLLAAVMLFEVVLTTVVRHVELNTETPALFTLVTLAMNQSISVRIREAVIAYPGFLLEKIHEAHAEERIRIARELHDRVGHGVSAAQRQLELFDLCRETVPASAAIRVENAQRAIHEAMLDLHDVISGLRTDERIQSLAKALRTYLDSARVHDVDIRLVVNGDETWMSAAVRDESFLVVREAVLNALRHASPVAILIRVDIAPHELRASVEDDGVGFDLAGAGASGGAGIASMRERAELMGGTLVISPHLARGTRMELLVPLRGAPVLWSHLTSRRFLSSMITRCSGRVCGRSSRRRTTWSSSARQRTARRPLKRPLASVPTLSCWT